MGRYMTAMEMWSSLEALGGSASIHSKPLLTNNVSTVLICQPLYKSACVTASWLMRGILKGGTCHKVLNRGALS